VSQVSSFGGCELASNRQGGDSVVNQRHAVAVLPGS
jgi:hypothetical protein